MILTEMMMHMKKILITYATNAGSTADVAEMIKQAIENKEAPGGGQTGERSDRSRPL